jgi:hypothetical protein
MKKIVYLLAALPLLGAGPEQEIRGVLDAQVAAWNRGDYGCGHHSPPHLQDGMTPRLARHPAPAEMVV